MSRWEKGQIKMKISLEFIPDVPEEAVWSSGDWQPMPGVAIAP
ncbi:KGK domain-containing protein [Laspinema olomoucense]|nr:MULTISPECIES: KGK domain-containing protein [unclassified Laspinema]